MVSDNADLFPQSLLVWRGSKASELLEISGLPVGVGRGTSKFPGMVRDRKLCLLFVEANFLYGNF